MIRVSVTVVIDGMIRVSVTLVSDRQDHHEPVFYERGGHTMPTQDALPAGAAATEGRAIPPRRASGRGGCCATCHRQQAQVIALLECLVLRGMHGHIPLTPEGYLASLYQAAADRALTA